MELRGVEPHFTLLREQAAPWWLWLASVVLHLPVLFFFFGVLFWQSSERWQSLDSSTRNPSELHQVIHLTLPWSPMSSGPELLKVDATPVGEPRLTTSTSTATQAAAEPPVQPLPGATVVAAPPVTLPDSGSGAAATSGSLVSTGTSGSPESVAQPTLAPAYGTGVLWGHLRPTSAEELAKEVLGLEQGESLDSTLVVRLQRYIDSMAVDARGNRPPSWVVSLRGKQVGVDQQWIYLGPIRIPTAVLALLPINVQANPTEAEYGRRLASMRADLLQAAQRARNYAEFRENVEQLRREKEAEREFRRNQRGGGPSLEPS